MVLPVSKELPLLNPRIGLLVMVSLNVLFEMIGRK